MVRAGVSVFLCQRLPLVTVLTFLLDKNPKRTSGEFNQVATTGRWNKGLKLYRFN